MKTPVFVPHPYQPLEGESINPRLWIGTWSMGGESWGGSDDRESRRVLENAFEYGLCHVDTAGFYGHGKSEHLIAEAVGNRRKKIFIATKGGLEWNGKKVLHAGRPEDLRRALFQSLERLRTDYIDLFLLHWPDPSVDVEKSLEAIRGFQKEGLVRFWGAGNLGESALKTCFNPGERIVHELPYSPVNREHEKTLEILKGEARAYNLVYSPFEQGLLISGKAFLGNKDVRNRNPRFSSPLVRAWVEKFHALSAVSTISRAEVVLSWILSRDFVDAVVPGPRTIAQLGEWVGLAREKVDWSKIDSSLLDHLERG